MRALWSSAGWRHVWRTEGSLDQWVGANVAAALPAFVLPLSAGERGMILMGGILVLAMASMNTAMGRVVDDISTARRDRAMRANNVGSAPLGVHSRRGRRRPGLCDLGDFILIPARRKRRPTWTD